MLGRQGEEEGVEGAIVELVEGVADHQPQRPFPSLKESLLMVQRRPLILLFFCFFLLPCREEEWWFLCSNDLTYRGSSVDIVKGDEVHR